MLIKASAIDSAIATVKAHRRQDSFKSDPVGWAQYMLGTDEGTLWEQAAGDRQGCGGEQLDGREGRPRRGEVPTDGCADLLVG